VNRAAGWDQVDTGSDLQARGIAEQLCLLEGNILEEAEAVPALLGRVSIRNDDRFLVAFNDGEIALISALLGKQMV
jgi:hypothetical protein